MTTLSSGKDHQPNKLTGTNMFGLCVVYLFAKFFCLSGPSSRGRAVELLEPSGIKFYYYYYYCFNEPIVHELCD